MTPLQLPEPLYDAILAALDASPAERDAAIERLCRAEPDHAEAVRRTIEQALDAQPSTSRPGIGGNAPAAPSAMLAAAAVPPGIGPFRLLAPIGAGGMGAVWLAQRDTPRQHVAIKLIRPGLHSGALLARFDRERAALARMNHDAIARIFDIGVLDDGRPWFAMEHVPGEPITTFSDRHRLSLEQRVRLLIDVCAGVQHAHENGVVHRDLKPGNLLVVDQRGRRAVKIIDFGLARDLQPQAPADGATAAGAWLGTVEYMAPEQAAGDPAAIDARTDVYALGVVLYELLTAELPFPTSELRALGPAEIERRLREVEPALPSARAAARRDAGSTARAAAARGLTPTALVRRLRGEVDWIVGRALAKEPARRYPSAQAFADDLQRFLQQRAVHARPPSATYRLRKLVRRHRVVVASAAAVLLVTLGATSVAAAGRTARQRDQARAQAQSARDTGRWEDALRASLAIEHLGDADPAELLLLRADAWEGLGRSEPIAALAAALTPQPSGSNAARVALLVAKETADPKASVAATRAVLAMHDEHGVALPPADVSFARAWIADDLADVERQLRETLRADPRHLSSLRALAPVLLAQGKIDAALELVQQQMLLMPRALEPLLLRVFALTLAGRRIELASAQADLAARDPELAKGMAALADIVLGFDDQMRLFGSRGLNWVGRSLAATAGLTPPPSIGPYPDAAAMDAPIMKLLARLPSLATTLRKRIDGTSLRLRLVPALAREYRWLLQGAPLLLMRLASGKSLELPERAYAFVRAAQGDTLEQLRRAREVTGFTAALPGTAQFDHVLGLVRAFEQWVGWRNAGRKEPDTCSPLVHEECNGLLTCHDLTEDDLHGLLCLLAASGVADSSHLASKALVQWEMLHGATLRSVRLRVELSIKRGLRAEAADALQQLRTKTPEPADLDALAQRVDEMRADAPRR